MRRTHDAVTEISEREGLTRPLLIGVTVLTSADAAALAEVGLPADPEELVLRLAALTQKCGLDGVVASPREIALVRALAGQSNFLIVTPGVRPIGAAAHDQKRIMTPAEAIKAGADYLVMGRAILEADDPAHAAAEIIEEMAQALSFKS
jgi:orotidine-5'-phosphate decarboxylase